MKIVLPLTTNDALPERYGAAERFAVFEVDRAARRVRRKIVIVPSGSRPCRWPTLFRSMGADVLMVGRIGASARQRVERHGVTIIGGRFGAPVERLVEEWLSGNVAIAPAAPCRRRA